MFQSAVAGGVASDSLEVRTQTVELKKMTRELCHELFKAWENDPSIYMDMSQFKPFCYHEAAVDRYFDAKSEPSRNDVCDHARR